MPKVKSRTEEFEDYKNIIKFLHPRIQSKNELIQKALTHLLEAAYKNLDEAVQELRDYIEGRAFQHVRKKQVLQYLESDAFKRIYSRDEPLCFLRDLFHLTSDGLDQIKLRGLNFFEQHLIYLAKTRRSTLDQCAASANSNGNSNSLPQTAIQTEQVLNEAQWLQRKLPVKRWYECAAEGGGKEAQCWLGEWYLDQGNVEKAIYWLVKSADQVFEKAQVLLATDGSITTEKISAAAQEHYSQSNKPKDEIEFSAYTLIVYNIFNKSESITEQDARVALLLLFHAANLDFKAAIGELDEFLVGDVSGFSGAEKMLAALEGHKPNARVDVSDPISMLNHLRNLPNLESINHLFDSFSNPKYVEPLKRSVDALNKSTLGSKRTEFVKAAATIYNAARENEDSDLGLEEFADNLAQTLEYCFLAFSNPDTCGLFEHGDHDVEIYAKDQPCIAWLAQRALQLAAEKDSLSACDENGAAEQAVTSESLVHVATCKA